MGFLSRFIIFSYSYSLSTVTKILDHYSENGFDQENQKLKFPKKDVDIVLSEVIAQQLNPLAMKVGEQFRLYGLRAKINFRSLLKSLGYRNNSKTVTDKEFEEFLELAEFMNFKYNPL